MRSWIAAACLTLVLACARATIDMQASVLTPSGTLPDTIDCDRPLVVKAGTERQGIAAEREWIDTQFPGHTAYSQALSQAKDRMFDVLMFNAADGRAISVCFDITSFFGKW
ncbi:MAG TPA: hypothetical protein VGQ18_05290 [Gemmatimonadales bacterium]|jgi:hypothetical protein|nr:hypothetical protein [Gemmatimonadales bacterium]